MSIQDLQTSRLDINNNYEIDLTFKQLDDISFKIVVYDKSLPADLSNYTARLKAFKPDQIPLIQNTKIYINDNVVTIKGDQQLGTTSGITKAELQFINKTTFEKKSTFYININVVASVLETERGISIATCTLLKEIENALDKIENIGDILFEATEVNDELKYTTIPSASTAKADLESSIDDANASKLALDQSKTTANNSKLALDLSITNAKNSKDALDLSKNVADDTKEALDESVEAANNFVQSHQNIENLVNQVNLNTEQMSDIKHYNIAYVETWGNDSTAVLGQIGKPFKTINSALDAVLPSLGGKIKVGIGAFDPVDKTKMKDGITIEGTHVPHVKDDYSGLEGGTIIKGAFQVINHHHVKLRNFGVDSGATVCAELYSDANNIEGITVSPFNIGGPFFDTPLLKGIVLENLVAICKNPTVAVHTILCEGVEGAYLNNLETYYGLHGMALKLVKSQANNLRAHGAGYDGITIKHSPDYYAPCHDSQFTNLYMDSINGVGAGFIFQGAVAGTYMINNTITNLECYGTDFGIKFNSSAGVIAGCTISNITLDGIVNIPIEFIGNITRNDLNNIYMSAPTTNGIVLSTNSDENNFRGLRLMSDPSTNNGVGIVIKGANNKFSSAYIRGFKLGGMDGSGADGLNYIDNFNFTGNLVSNFGSDVSKLIVDGYSGCLAYSSTSQSIPNGVNTILGFDSEKWDTNNIHDVTTNNSRLTCKVAGKYTIKGGVEFAANATGYRYLLLRINGSTVSYIPTVTNNANASVGTAMNISYDLPLNANDYVELAVIQNSGGALNVSNATLSISRIGN